MVLASKTDLFGNNSDGRSRSMIISSSAGVLKGSLMILSDPRTVASHAAVIGGLFAGVASMDKDAADSSDSITIWTDLIATLSASGSISAGDQVILSSVVNAVESSNVIAVNPQGKLVGIAMDDASGNLVSVRINK